jgi:hypothetical protein
LIACRKDDFGTLSRLRRQFDTCCTIIAARFVPSEIGYRQSLLVGTSRHFVALRSLIAMQHSAHWVERTAISIL